jgi:cytochrome c553
MKLVHLSRKGVQASWAGLAAALAALFLLAMLVAWSGILNIGASTGHLPVTNWFLHWAMRNAVRTQTTLTVTLNPVDPTDLAAAAGHYAATCASCHGAPGVRPSPVMQSTTPPAPDLARTPPEWTDEQLFWIIKHGVKFTPMPGWPSQHRDDEVRRMAAFVRRLPGMAPQTYRAMAYGPGGTAPVGEAVTLDEAAADCARCHGRDGRGRGQRDIPVLGGQTPAYLAASLQAYAAGRRESGVMQSAAARVEPALYGPLAARLAALPGLRRAGAASAEDPEAAAIVARGLPAAGVPACASCHARTRYPVLDGQKAAYMAGRLRRWRGDPKVVDARKSNAPMAVIARRIPEPMIDRLARYYERLGETAQSAAAPAD